MMPRSSPLLASPVALVVGMVGVVGLLAGCGDLSQEDLLFRQALPAREALEVRPAGATSEADDAPGTQTQALDEECTQAFDVKCQARNVSRGLNGITFLLLDLIDLIVQHPPTTRERGRRVWGPFFDNGNTSRFEMVRINGGASYRFCLHSVVGRIRDRDAADITCDTDVDDDSGLTKLLEGTLSPGALIGARARTGEGEMVLQTGRLPDLAGFGRTMTITFDNTDERTSIDIVVEGQRALGGVVEREPLEYTFTRETDGAGDFGFVLFANINRQDENLPRLERLDMVAKWNADESGRGLARVTEGDAGDEEFTVDQCWDADDAQVFLELDFSGDAELPTVEGDEGACLIDEDVVDALLPALE